MSDKYTIKYKAPWSFRWKKLKNVIGDEVLGGTPVIAKIQNPDRPKTTMDVVAGVTPYFCRAFTLEDNTIVFFPLTYKFIYPKERQALVAKQMSNEIGQQVQTRG